MDFLIEHGDGFIPIEVKAHFDQQDLRKLSSLLARSGFEKGLALSLREFGGSVERGAQLQIFPVWAFLLFPDKILKGLG